MTNPSFKELGEISESRYDVCVMVMKRAALLIDGSEPLVRSKGEKPVTVAIDEIMAKKVTEVSSVQPKPEEKNDETNEAEA